MERHFWTKVDSMHCSNIGAHIPSILELTFKEKQDFLNSFDLIFFDCDGVVWLAGGTIPHTHEAINLLKDAGKKCKFVSNNSIRTDAEYVEKFKRIGVRDVNDDDVVHPAKIITHFIKNHVPPDAQIFSICDRNANELFRRNGIDVKTLKIRDHLTVPKLVEIIQQCGDKMDLVVCDINLNLNYAQLACAAFYLEQNKQCKLIVGGSDAYIPLLSGVNVIGFSSFVEILAQQTETEPIVLGKPGKALGTELKEIYNIVDPKRVLFVGDTLKFDIGFAKHCGFQTLLVLSGIATKEDMLNAPLENRPDFHANGVSDFIEFFKDFKN